MTNTLTSGYTLKVSQNDSEGQRGSEEMSVAGSRRQFLSQSGGGAGLIALSMLDAASAADQSTPRGSGRTTHFPAAAQRVIWLFMHGGPSHIDLLDPKPQLIRFAGQPLPDSFGDVMTRRQVARNPLLAPVSRFRQHGESGIPVSDLMPHLSDCVDDLCVIRSMHGDSVNHPQSVYQMNTGSILMGNPSAGSWVAFGLGSENQDLPAFIVMPDPGGGLKGGPSAWGSGYLPATFQGVPVRSGASPILNLRSAGSLDDSQQQRNLDLIRYFNHQHRELRDQDDRLQARIDAYEMAFRMQSSAPELVDLTGETAETLRLYGIDRNHSREFGTRCLLARRMIERGVRFVQLYSGDTNGWDAHSDVLRNHSEHCMKTDRPIAGLLMDLKQRGLLDDTLVIWCGEFGRMPMSEQGTGRDHNPWGYSSWLAGAGISGGRTYGETDDIGLRAVVNPVSISNFHATILHLLGLDHERLTWFHNGLDKRLTGPDEAHVISGILS